MCCLAFIVNHSLSALYALAICSASLTSSTNQVMNGGVRETLFVISGIKSGLNTAQRERISDAVDGESTLCRGEIDLCNIGDEGPIDYFCSVTDAHLPV